MNDLRSRLIRLAYERPELRDRLLPLIKTARSNAAPAPAPAPSGGGDGGGGKPGGGKVIDFAEAKKKKEQGSKPSGGGSGRKDLAKTPEGAQKAFEDYKAKLTNPENSTKTVEDFLHPDAQTDSGDGGDGGDQAEQPANDSGGEQAQPKKTPSKPIKPKRVKVKNKDDMTPEERREEAENKVLVELNKKYQDKRDENGDLPPEIQSKADQEYSKAMDAFEKSEKDNAKKKVDEEKKKLLDSKKDSDKKNRDNHEESLIQKYKSRGMDDKAISSKVEKDMKKYDEKSKKRKDLEEAGGSVGGFIKKVVETAKGTKSKVQQWLNPETNPIINFVKNGTITLSDVDSGIKRRVVARHQARCASSRVAARYIEAKKTYRGMYGRWWWPTGSNKAKVGGPVLPLFDEMQWEAVDGDGGDSREAWSDEYVYYHRRSWDGYRYEIHWALENHSVADSWGYQGHAGAKWKWLNDKYRTSLNEVLIDALRLKVKSGSVNWYRPQGMFPSSVNGGHEIVACAQTYFEYDYRLVEVALYVKREDGKKLTADELEHIKKRLEL